jgi:hypothetical protein
VLDSRHDCVVDPSRLRHRRRSRTFFCSSAQSELRRGVVPAEATRPIEPCGPAAVSAERLTEDRTLAARLDVSQPRAPARTPAAAGTAPLSQPEMIAVHSTHLSEQGARMTSTEHQLTRAWELLSDAQRHPRAGPGGSDPQTGSRGPRNGCVGGRLSAKRGGALPSHLGCPVCPGRNERCLSWLSMPIPVIRWCSPHRCRCISSEAVRTRSKCSAGGSCSPAKQLVESRPGRGSPRWSTSTWALSRPRATPGQLSPPPRWLGHCGAASSGIESDGHDRGSRQSQRPLTTGLVHSH